MENNSLDLIPAEAQDALLEAGILLNGSQRQDSAFHHQNRGMAITLTDLEHTREFIAVRMHRTLSARELLSLSEKTLARYSNSSRGFLLICPRISTSARKAASEHHISFIALNNHRAQAPSVNIVFAPQAATEWKQELQPAAAATTQRRSWLPFTMAREFYFGQPRSQQQLAAALGISQARVSQIWKTFQQRGILKKTISQDGKPQWHLPNINRFLRWWLAEYPGPGGITSSWYSQTELATQVSRIKNLANANKQPDPLISGDVAADYYAPWGRPRSAVVYTQQSHDLTPLGLTPCHPEQATVLQVVPQDSGIWLHPQCRVSHTQQTIHLADPLQVLFDIAHGHHPDQDQSLEKMMLSITNQLKHDGR